MRALVVVAIAAAHAFGFSAHADPIPAGALGVFTGVVAGTGADADRMGFGYYQIGAQASWQPMKSERHIGWTLRWSTMFAAFYGGSAAHIDSSLRTTQMDLTLGVRVRPWSTRSRYLTLRGGGELLRANEPIPTNRSMEGSRKFVGATASVGLDQYAIGMMFNLEVRYSMIGGTGPTSLALLVGAAFVGP